VGLAEQIPASEYAALVELYATTDGPNWINREGWNDPGAPFWFGVTVGFFEYDEATGQILRTGHVSELDLAHNQLSGRIPGNLPYLTEIRWLDLSFNSLNGEVPASFSSFQDWQNCALNLSHNQLSGDLPPLDPRYFLSVDIRYNCFNVFAGSQPLAVLAVIPVPLFQPQSAGCVPGLVDQIPAGEYAALVDFYWSTGGSNWTQNEGWNDPAATFWTGVDVSGFQYDPDSGEVLSLGTVTALYLPQNNLVGSLPESLGTLVNLEDLTLYDNKLVGNIPWNLGNLGRLVSIVLHRNHLTGSIPDSLGNLVHLRDLSLSLNDLSGSIPGSFGNLVSLDALVLHSNGLEGSVPATVWNLPVLRVISLESNRLSGELSWSLTVSPTLEGIGLENNCFDITPGSSVRAVIDTLLANRRVGVGFQPQLACGQRVLGDMNDDGCVDRNDLAAIMAQIRGRSQDPDGDLNGDGKVDIADARFLVIHFSNSDGSPCDSEE
jgi:hypothetical protein